MRLFLAALSLVVMASCQSSKTSSAHTKNAVSVKENIVVDPSFVQSREVLTFDALSLEESERKSLEEKYPATLEVFDAGESLSSLNIIELFRSNVRTNLINAYVRQNGTKPLKPLDIEALFQAGVDEKEIDIALKNQR